MMERCNKAAEGFECLKFARHAGDCECVTTEAFNTSMKLAEDEFLYGNSYALQNADGTVTRLDPTKIVINVGERLDGTMMNRLRGELKKHVDGRVLLVEEIKKLRKQ